MLTVEMMDKFRIERLQPMAGDRHPDVIESSYHHLKAIGSMVSMIDAINALMGRVIAGELVVLTPQSFCYFPADQFPLEDSDTFVEYLDNVCGSCHRAVEDYDMKTIDGPTDHIRNLIAIFEDTVKAYKNALAEGQSFLNVAVYVTVGYNLALAIGWTEQ